MTLEHGSDDDIRWLLPFCDTIFGADIDASLAFLLHVFGEMKVENNSRVLDAGCGVGRLTHPLALQGFEVVGIDTNPVYIDYAKTRNTGSPISPTFDLDSITSLSTQPDGCFDSVICMLSVFHYLVGREDAENAMKAISRVLKPSGCFVIDLFNPFSILKSFQEVRTLTYRQGEYSIEHTFEHELFPAHQRWDHVGTISLFLDGKKLNSTSELHSIRHYTFYELCSLAKIAGLKVCDSYASYDSRTPSKWDSDVPDGSRMIVVGKKDS
ncbi:class I SAM-dependent methyltransferase [Roseiconus lacunae]|uniref:class I SAM-dependent methyltransferase n=1 Tax=Roseiconus lacunae TaxID=2605694 RepID=UPI0011F2D290|nr:class I SAM-dependent methyltransferase [Roseiconus lacunae]